MDQLPVRLLLILPWVCFWEIPRIRAVISRVLMTMTTYVGHSRGFVSLLWCVKVPPEMPVMVNLVEFVPKRDSVAYLKSISKTG